MKISSKGRYAVRIMAQLAKNPIEYISANELSIKQEISAKYLEQILKLLTKAKLVESLRGAQGGYKLTRKVEEYSIADILQVTDDLPKLAPCLVDNSYCSRSDNCDSIGCWEHLSLIIVNYLKGVSLADIIK